MTQADRIRDVAFRRFVLPARNRGEPVVVISAAQVHRLLGLHNGFPAVCSALAGRKFSEFAGVQLLETSEPCPSSTTTFRFAVNGGHSLEIECMPQIDRLALEQRASRDLPADTAGVSGKLDLDGAVVLVSCVKTKRAYDAPARDLYCSPRFLKARRAVETRRGRWLILSAKYGLLEPETVISPYEKTLNAMNLGDRQAWAARVMRELPAKLDGRKRVVFLAGASYREFLAPALVKLGISVEAPMAHMPNGVQLAWLGGLS